MSPLKNAVLEIIDQLAIGEDRIISSNNTRAQIINLLLEERAITREEIIDRLLCRILSVGRDSYNHHRSVTAYTVWPDHTISPQCLAHAIVHSELSQREREKILYEGETETEFLDRYYRVQLPEELLLQLTTLEERPIPDKSRSSCC